MPRLQILLPCLLVIAPAVAAAPPGEQDPEVAYAEQVLHEGKVSTDGAELLGFIRRHTLSPEDRDRLAGLTRQLGHDEFEMREQAARRLVEAGRAAVPHLSLGVTSPDPEVVWRSRHCLEAIAMGQETILLAAAARLLQERRPPGAVEVLLGYLPDADAPEIEQAIFATLRALADRETEANRLAEATRSKKPIQRAAAAHALGEASARAVPHLKPLLKDEEERVRFEAALALLRLGERSATPALVALLETAPPVRCWQIEEALLRLAGEDAPAVSVAGGSAEERRKSQQAWLVWWNEHGSRVDLARLSAVTRPLGLTLVCEFDGAEGGGRVCELGKDGRVRWEITGLQGVNDAQLLPGGRVLMAERNGGRVTERDRRGNILWEARAPGSPISCQRLPSGNTLIATFDQLMEVTREGKRVREYSHRSGFRHALRTPAGHILFISSSGEVVELDAGWQEVRRITPAAHGAGAGYWASIEPLPGGRFLITLGGAGKVVEIDTTGKICWECTLSQPVHATRLHNGNTLVSLFEGRCLVEVDRGGKEIARIPLKGRPFVVRRY